MKRRIISMFLVVAAMAAMMSASAFAAQNIDLKVTVDDALVEFPDAKPFADDNNRTLIPVRFVTEAMGADVSWDQASQTAIIEKDGTKVEITIGQKNIKVTKDGSTKTVTMDTVAVAKDGRTFVPIRFVAEALGAYVDYSDLYKAVEIVMPEEVTADEIKRLRSYDLIQWWPTEGASNEWFVNKDEYKFFKGNYWFSNSHLFLISQPDDTKQDVKNDFLRTKAPAGTNALDYANFTVDYIESELETKSYPGASGSFVLPGWWSDGGTTVSFRTDESLSYQMICPPQACISIRGVIEVTKDTDKSLELFSNKFSIDNPEVGKVYTMDAEFIVANDQYGFLDSVDGYYFDDNGNPVEFWKYTR